jgi:hypothetical protein
VSSPPRRGRWAPLASWGLLALFLLPACLPLLHAASLPCTHDNVLHYYRVTAMRDALRHGWLFSRWVPNLALGYGYPFFNFREPLPYLLGEGLVLLGLPVPLVLGVMYILCLLAGARGAYRLARDLFGARAGWIAALAYGLGPYVLLDVLRRGNLTESVALALLPWLLWSFRRLVLRGRRRDVVLAVLLLSALFLSHNISSLLFAPFLGGYAVLLAWLHRERRAWPWAFAAVALALAITAWFWFPALTEQDTVQLHLSRTTRNNDFHYNFATWREMLLTPPLPYDPDFLNPPMRVPLGLATGLLAVIGVILGLWRARTTEQRATLGFFALVALAYLWMSTPASVRVWEAIPMLAFVQFPWRLVGRALLPVALLAGAGQIGKSANRQIGKSGIENRVSRFAAYAARFVFPLALIVLVVFAWPDTYPPKGVCPMKPYPEMADLYAYEQQGWMGVDPEGSYFPVWVEQHPTDTALAEAFARGELPRRMDPAAMPSGAEVMQATYRPLRARLVVVSPVAFTARWLGFYYPGWRVWVDGDRVPVAPEQDTGLLTFEVPAGQHTIAVRFGPTPLRAAATGVSLVGLMALGLLLWRAPFRPAPPAPGSTPGARVRPGRLLALALGLLAIKLLVVDRVPNPLRHARLATGALPEVRTPLHQPFEGGQTLLGYTLGDPVAPADGEIAVELLWGTRERSAVAYRTSVLLMGPDGSAWSSGGTARPRGYEPPLPTTMRHPGQYAYDPHIVVALPGTPPGAYRAVVALFDRETLAPASPLGADGNPLGPDLTLGPVRLLPPDRMPSLAALDVPEDAALRACGPLGLWQMTADRAQAAPGGLVGLRWVWEALADPADPLTVTLSLRSAAGDAVPFERVPPVAAWWPTTAWSAGERWVGRPVVRLPGGLEGGTYRLELRLDGCAEPLGAVPLEVVAPARGWTVPEDLTPVDVVFGDRVRLAGYRLEPTAPDPGDRLTVHLAWQAMAEMSASYHVFVHLTDAEGRLWAQDDGVPAGWTRPTPGWAVGEVVTEARALDLPADLPPGTYELRMGLYRPGAPRLLTAEGADGFALDVVIR